MKLIIIELRLRIQFVLICLPFSIFAQTTVQGNVSGVWNYEQSPIIVKNSLLLPEDSTLIIQPGVEITFEGHYDFVIHGLLQAMGSPDSMIVFTRKLPMEIYNWQGLRFIDADSNCCLKYCRIEYVTADNNGGGIYCSNSSILITDCIIQKNHAHHYGGGIYIENGAPRIVNNDIMNNISGLSGSIFDSYDGSGGGIYCVDSSPSIVSNTIMRNRCGYEGSIWGARGGGICIDGNSSAVILNNVIVENSAIDLASDGGGIYSNGNNVLIVNNVIYGNMSTLYGGGGISGNSHTKVLNSIIWQNQTQLPSGNELNQVDGSVIISYSNIQGGFDGAENIDQDPLFMNASNRDFGLLGNSPCIDSGHPNALYNDFDCTRNDMGCSGGSLIGINYLEYLFPSCKPDEIMYADDLEFYNFRDTGFTITHFVLSDPINFYSINDLPVEIGSFKKAYIPVAFNPENMGRFESDLEIYSSDLCGQTRITIRLIGLSHTNQIEGIVTGTLSNEFSPYLVSGDIYIPENTSLIIEPGVHLLFGGPYQIEIKGLLIAEGAENDSIIFDRFNESDDSKWLGLRFMDADSSSTVRYCVIQYVKNEGTGGAIYTSNSRITICNNRISNNEATYGGGIYCFGNYPQKRGAGPVITDNIIQKNKAEHGAGISVNYFFEEGNCLIERNTIEQNIASDRGGGVFCFQSHPVMNNNTIARNTARVGGGIYCQYKSLPVIQNNMIRSNTANWGGGIGVKDCSPSIDNNKILNNTAAGADGSGGGGIDCEVDSDPIITHNLFCRNQSVDGGGIQCWNASSPVIINNTFCFNTAERGGALIAGDQCLPVVMNTIMWADSADQGPEILLIASEVEASYCDIEDGWEGEGNIGSDPLFLNAHEDNYTLATGSPCINMGNPDSRFNDTDGSRNDMGAYGGAQIIAWTGLENTENSELPFKFEVSQSYPNPFNSQNTIQYSLERPSHVIIEIVNLRGQVVESVFNEYQEPGVYKYSWQPVNYPSGIYFYKFNAENRSLIRKCILIK